MNTHPMTQLGCDPFRIDQRFIRRNVEIQVSLMDPAEGTQRGPKRRAGPFTGVAVHLPSAISIIIPRPLVHAVADGGMARMAPPRALPLSGIEQRAARRKVLGDQGRAGARVCTVADPQALLPRLARDPTADRGTIIGIGTMPFPFIGAPPGRIAGVRLRWAFCPPRCGTARRLQRRCPSSQPSVPYRLCWLESAAGGDGAVA
jgi:hypothetical protein